jgi:hypothetical protein
MSSVYVAEETALGRRVGERFRQEIRFAARLTHPHILPLLTVAGLAQSLARHELFGMEASPGVRRCSIHCGSCGATGS